MTAPEAALPDAPILGVDVTPDVTSFTALTTVLPTPLLDRRSDRAVPTFS
jgi:hypothetical protein